MQIPFPFAKFICMIIGHKWKSMPLLFKMEFEKMFYLRVSCVRCFAQSFVEKDKIKWEKK